MTMTDCRIIKWLAEKMCELRKIINETDEKEALELLYQVRDDLEASRRRHREKCRHCFGRPTYGDLADADDLRSMCQSPREFHLDEEAFAKASPELGVTSCFFEGNVMVLRAITLLGWMHTKTNLGIEMLTIHENGTV